jgi:hypothetical protein
LKVNKGIEGVHEWMIAYFIDEFGKDAIRGIEMLYVFSRRLCEQQMMDVPDEWISEMMNKLYGEVVGGVHPELNAYAPGIVGGETNIDGLGHVRDTVKCHKVREFLSHHQIPMRACWIAAAIIRGWEIYDTIDDLQSVFDDRQRQMAEDVVRYLFVSKLRVLSPGMSDVFDSVNKGGIQITRR